MNKIKFNINFHVHEKLGENWWKLTRVIHVEITTWIPFANNI